MKSVVLALGCLVLLGAPVRAQEGESPAKAHLDAGDKKLQAGDPKGALAEFEKAIEADPETWRGYFGRAIARLATGDHKGAAADVDTAFEKEPDANVAWRLYTVRSDAKQGTGDYEGALADLDKAIEFNPRSLGAYYQRAQLKSAKGDFKGAIADYSTYVNNNPRSPSGFSARAQVKAWTGDIDGAMEDLEAAIFNGEMLPAPDSSALSTRGRVKVNQGDVEGGMEDLDRAVELTPENGGAYFSRGLVKFDIGKPKGALKDLQKSVELDPASHEYARFYIFLLRTELKQEQQAITELKAYGESRDGKDDWVAKVIAHLCGELSAEKFLEAAKSDSEIGTRMHECEAHWYIAAKLLAKDKNADVKTHLEACVAANQRGFIEYQSAKLALK